MNFWYSFYYFLIWPLQKLLFPCKMLGRENIPKGPAIVCANHTALIDPAFLLLAFGRRDHLFFMGKAELFDIPVIGSIFRSVGAFPVNRGETDIQSARTVMKHLKNGQKIMMFPEGTRVADGETAEAKTGAVRFATKLNVPIVPVFLSGNKKLFRKSLLSIGKPFKLDPPTGKNYDPLAAKLMEHIHCLEAEH